MSTSAPVTKKTLCNRDCPDACSIVATVEDGRVTRLAGDPDHPITQGFLCHRTSQFLHTQYSADRLTTPLLRKNGTLVPVSWDEALDTAASRLTAIRDEHGPAAIFHYRSGGTLGVLASLVDHFFQLFGPVTVKRGDICSGAGDFAQIEDFGEEDSHDLFDLYHSRNILLWGKNVFTSSPHTIPVLREARSRGARLLLIDPVHHKTASLCDTFIQPRPGGDFALAMAVARLLFERGHTDPDAPSYCDHLDSFRQMAESKSVPEWCLEADVTPAQAEDIASRLGPGRPTAILVGWGMARRTNGASIVRALDALCSISGNLGVPGGGVSFYFKRRAAFDTTFKEGAPAAPRTICEPLFGPEVLAAKSPEIKALWVTAGNPVAMLPDSASVAKAIETREFSVVADSFLTDTARRATLVLPVTTLLEADDLLGAYGHHYIGVATPVVSPPPGVKTDLQIVQELARRVGLGDALAGTARDWKRRILAPRLSPHGVTLETLEQGAVKSPLARPVLFADRKLPTPSGKVNLLHTPPPLPDAPVEYNLWWTSVSTERSQSSQWARPQKGPLVVTVHPDSAAGVPDGGLARVESPRGSLTVQLRHDPRQRKDIALAPKGGHFDEGRAANALVTARLTDFGEGGAIYDDRVRILPLEHT
ncbi:MAG: molybdopterin-dependent oxidoreductase [Polyangiaceae bacterium]